jgi:hypothetical protein
MLLWLAVGRPRDTAVAVVLKIMVTMVVLVRVFCTTHKGEVSLTDLMLWNQNAAAGRGRFLANVRPGLNNLYGRCSGHTSSSSYGRLWKLMEGRR